MSSSFLDISLFLTKRNYEVLKIKVLPCLELLLNFTALINWIVSERCVERFLAFSLIISRLYKLSAYARNWWNKWESELSEVSRTWNCIVQLNTLCRQISCIVAMAFLRHKIRFIPNFKFNYLYDAHSSSKWISE